MGYEISYPSFGEEKKYKGKRKWKPSAWFSIALVVALVFGALSIKGRMLPWVRQYLLPGDPEVTAVALDGLWEDLRAGDSLPEALAAFCREIVENAELS